MSKTLVLAIPADKLEKAVIEGERFYTIDLRMDMEQFASALAEGTKRKCDIAILNPCFCGCAVSLGCRKKVLEEDDDEEEE